MHPINPFFRRLTQRFHHDEDGLTSAEMMIIAGLIVIPLVIVLTYFRDQVSDYLKTMWDKIKGETSPTPSKGGQGW